MIYNDVKVLGTDESRPSSSYSLTILSCKWLRLAFSSLCLFLIFGGGRSATTVQCPLSNNADDNVFALLTEGSGLISNTASWAVSFILLCVRFIHIRERFTVLAKKLKENKKKRKEKMRKSPS